MNGAEGIGTGWSTKVPNFNPRDIVDNVRLMINNEPIRPMVIIDVIDDLIIIIAASVVQKFSRYN